MKDGFGEEDGMGKCENEDKRTVQFDDDGGGSRGSELVVRGLASQVPASI